MGSIIEATGSALPALVVTNEQLIQTTGIDSSDAWIRSRTGIEQRRIACDGPSESTAALGKTAIDNALEMISGKLPENLGHLICATITPDHTFPASSCEILAKLGLRGVRAYDLSSACTGALQAIVSADDWLKSHPDKRAIVVGADRLSRITDWSDRGSCILFGDGAGAIVMKGDPDQPGVIDSVIKNYPDELDVLVGDPCYQLPPFIEANEQSAHDDSFPRSIKMNGTEVYKFAIRKPAEVFKELLERNNLTIDDIDFVVPHQANLRIIEALQTKLAIPAEKVVINIQKVGNTSAASIPMALDTLIRSGRVKSGGKAVLVGFGAGLSVAAVLVDLQPFLCENHN